ncbi:aminoacyl-tRNA ligase [Cucumis melo var. makuwa]|uniref:Aminoacyl-tRNA ligase n=1 Tax=Cucumis melo var. makuwa TaxID=1194695 RepID=A0A5D3BD43_CUCMM|nr:aminoacyl-tRNA ligase [Cucumis melo var. makuwa]
MRLRKLEVPIFKGEECKSVDGWLHRVERYFMVNRLTEKDKLDVAVLCWEGEALDWFQWKGDRDSIMSWSEFWQLLWKRFRPFDQGDNERY